MSDPNFTEFEKGERFALLEMRSFITRIALTKKGKRLENEVQSYCATRLSDIRTDAMSREEVR